MAKILILGGGFGGVMAAERLAEQVNDEHQITLVSRNRNFVFYPELVRLAFGKCEVADASFDLRHALLDRRINFIEAEVARIDPVEQKVTIAHGEVEGRLPYDYLIFALGRRLATERVTGFFEHAHHLLNIDKAINFGQALERFEQGRAVLGQCPGARLPVPVYESAFALAAKLEKAGVRDRVRITVVSPETVESEVGDAAGALALKDALDERQIEVISNFRVASVTQNTVSTTDGDVLDFDLLMLVPPFRGSSAASHVGITSTEGYINVDFTMRVADQERLYAVGDCVNFDGPKMGHMAVRQAEIAARNLAAQIAGHDPTAHYVHEMKFVIEGAARGGLYLHKEIGQKGSVTVKQGPFWRWAKHAQKASWILTHS